METGRWPLRGEGEWRVGICTCRQNPETVGPRPWISRLCSFQIRWATGSPLLRRCPARNLGFTEPCDHYNRGREWTPRRSILLCSPSCRCSAQSLLWLDIVLFFVWLFLFLV